MSNSRLAVWVSQYVTLTVVIHCYCEIHKPESSYQGPASPGGPLHDQPPTRLVDDFITENKSISRRDANDTLINAIPLNGHRLIGDLSLEFQFVMFPIE